MTALAAWWRAARHLLPHQVRAIRGATTATHDHGTDVGDATTELLREVCARNGLAPDEIISAIFTVTPDLTSAFPAAAARTLGWGDVPLLCATEIPVPGAPPRCVRVLLHVERAWFAAPPRHVYLRGAVGLRPDLVAGGKPGRREGGTGPVGGEGRVAPTGLAATRR